MKSSKTTLMDQVVRCAPRVCRVVTVPLTFAALLRQQLKEVTANGVELVLVSSPGPELAELLDDVGLPHLSVPMSRQPLTLVDLRAVYALTKLFARERFDIVHSSTPKAGLLAMTAARLARVKIRMHTFTGLVWETMSRRKAAIIRKGDRAIARMATHCYADGHSQIEQLEAYKVVPPGKVRVLGHGSIAGVDLARFTPSLRDEAVVATCKDELTIPRSARVIVFIGRVTRDKGITELTDAFQHLSHELPDLHLLLVGPAESAREPLPAETLAVLHHHPRVRLTGFTTQPERYLAAADVFCLPSYREGFGSVIIEAAALGIPAVATRVTGLVDSVIDGETGLLVPPRQSAALTEALRTLLLDPMRRHVLGAHARERARTYYDAALVNGLVVEEYRRLTKVSVST